MANQAPQPSAKSQWAITAPKVAPVLVVDNDKIVQKSRPDYSQEEAFEIIKQSKKPVIVITRESAESYGGMMWYISKSFPNVPIMVEDGGNIDGGPVRDAFMAKATFKGNMMTNKNQNRMQCADTIIVLGQNPKTVSAFSKDGQTILSDHTVDGGVNIATVSFSDEMKTIGQGWKNWNQANMGYRGRCF